MKYWIFFFFRKRNYKTENLLKNKLSKNKSFQHTQNVKKYLFRKINKISYTFKAIKCTIFF